MNGINRAFWRGKRVLVTGHTGFKGSWLCLWLLELGAEVLGYSLPPSAERDNYTLCGMEKRMSSIYGNILDPAQLEEAFAAHQPEVVFHLAAQPLVRLSYKQPRLTYETNVMGTLNVLEAIRHSHSVHSAVMVTTDKCYENQNQLRGYQETDPMGGYDPYSSSKGCAELLVSAYRRSFFSSGDCPAAVATARAGNVIGGGDWAVDRLVPDCIRSFEVEQPVQLRRPQALRPWQFVLEPLGGYLLLAERLWEEPEAYSGGWNFGPEPDRMATVGDIADRIAAIYGGGTVERCVDTSGPHEDQVLLLDISKAKEQLGWRPCLELEEALCWTAEWYRDYRKIDPSEICRRQIDTFSARAKGRYR